MLGEGRHCARGHAVWFAVGSWDGPLGVLVEVQGQGGEEALWAGAEGLGCVQMVLVTSGVG